MKQECAKEAKVTEESANPQESGNEMMVF